MAFTHLHVHSEYSLLDGLIKINDLVDTVVAQGGTAVALTDHGNMYGTFKFYLQCKAKGIKPIIGIEAYKAKKSRFDKPGAADRDQNHLLLIAKDYTGYKNLMKLTTEAHLDGFYYKPRVDFEIMEKYSEGIIAFSGCLSAEIPTLIRNEEMDKAETALKKYLEIYKDNFYIELQRYSNNEVLDRVNTKLIEFSKKYGIPVVATNDVHYLTREDAYAQEVLLCIQTQHNMYEKNRPMSMIETPEYYFRSEAEMKGLFTDIPEAIENTQKIVDMCNVEIPYGKWILPHYPLEEGDTPEKALRALVAKKAAARSTDNEVTRKRIAYELDVITSRGYSTYFLIVADFVNWAKDKGIAVGPGRGSVAGSLVAYILKITDIDPLVYNLPFERFLNPDRPTPPDIDIDFADTRREEVLAYVTKLYGNDKVAQIITFGRMEARMAVRDVARALGYSYSTGDRIAKMIPIGKQGFGMTIDKAMDENPALKFSYQNEEETKKVLDVARRVEGLARHSSVHAAGVVISDKNLTEYVPLQREAKGDRIITQYDMYCLDMNAVSDNKAVGLMKIDFLGLRNLTILENAIHFVKETRGEDVDIHTISLDDPKTYELIAEGRTIGVFQLESMGMRRLAKDLKPTKLTDISAMVALYRPGPMDLIPIFLEGKKNVSKIKYLHKDLKPILEETYGILVYQEQVMEIANKIAGFSMSEADILRMAMGKKKKALMKQEQIKFMDMCLKRGYTKKMAESVFGFIEKFAGYGFNKPHSACYALIAYWTAYMKANYSVEYMTALLSAELQGAAGSVREVKIIQSIDECKAMKIGVLPPEINKSTYDFKIEGEAIRFGLSAIKNVGSAAIDSVIEARKSGPFTGLKDFLQRVDVRKANKKTIESLVKAGAFDAFGNRASLLAYYPVVLEEVVRGKKGVEDGQFNLFAEEKTVGSKEILPDIPELSENELLNMEREVIGFSITKNPLQQYKFIIDKKVQKKIGELTMEDVGTSFVLAGNVSRVKHVTTKKNNDAMAFVTIFDETGSIDVVVFPKLFATSKALWTPNTVVMFKGKLDTKDDRLSMVIENAVDLARVAQNY